MSKAAMFYELAEGEFSTMVQKDFEEAQAIVAKRGCKATLSIEIVIFPENREELGTGRVEFKSQVKAPPKKSIPYITDLEKGVIVETGIRQTGIFSQPQPEAAGKTTPFSPKVGNA